MQQVAQGQWHELIELKAGEISFKALTFGLSESTFTWLHKAATDTLPCASYLKRINKITDSACNICGHRPESLKHILNCCQYSLINGRYTWRHNTVLHYLVSALTEDLLPSNEIAILVDLPNNPLIPTPGQPTVRTIPEDILITELRPDLSIINRKKKEIRIVELSICWDQDHERARRRKEDRYEPLIAELLERGWKSTLITIEIGARGFTANDTASSLKTLFHDKKRRTTHLKNMNKLAISCSHKLFIERNNPLWLPTSTNYLTLFSPSPEHL